MGRRKKSTADEDFLILVDFVNSFEKFGRGWGPSWWQYERDTTTVFDMNMIVWPHGTYPRSFMRFQKTSSWGAGFLPLSVRRLAMDL